MLSETELIDKLVKDFADSIKQKAESIDNLKKQQETAKKLKEDIRNEKSK